MYTRKILVLIIIPHIIVLIQCEQYKVTDQVYLDISVNDEYLGRIVIGLFGEVAPKTVANFKKLASSGIDGKRYKGTIFHRVVERFMIQGGDVVNNDGTGSISIYGKHFPDENFTIKHSGPGIVSMANGGRNTNGCQFFITTMQTPWLDGYHTAFGKVVKGQEYVHTIEHFETDDNHRPLKEVKIIRSGLLKMKSPYYESDDPYELTLWAWLKAGWFPLSFSFAILGFFHYLIMQLNSFKSFQ